MDELVRIHPETNNSIRDIVTPSTTESCQKDGDSDDSDSDSLVEDVDVLFARLMFEHQIKELKQMLNTMDQENTVRSIISCASDILTHIVEIWQHIRLDLAESRDQVVTLIMKNSLLQRKFDGVVKARDRAIEAHAIGQQEITRLELEVLRLQRLLHPLADESSILNSQARSQTRPRPRPRPRNQQGVLRS